MSDDGPNYLPAEHTRQSFEDGKRRYPQIMAALADDDPLPYLIAANERLHAEVQRLTDHHAVYAQSIADYRDCIETYREAANALQAEMLGLRSERDTLRADLATSEQTIAALKAQLQRVKEAAE